MSVSREKTCLIDNKSKFWVTDKNFYISWLLERTVMPCSTSESVDSPFLLQYLRTRCHNLINTDSAFSYNWGQLRQLKRGELSSGPTLPSDVCWEGAQQACAFPRKISGKSVKSTHRPWSYEYYFSPVRLRGQPVDSFFFSRGLCFFFWKKIVNVMISGLVIWKSDVHEKLCANTCPGAWSYLPNLILAAHSQEFIHAFLGQEHGLSCT